MSRNLGLLLRLVGPLIEIVALMAYLQNRGRDVRILGVPVETLCFVGIGLGLCLVIAGLGLSYRRPRPRKRPSFDLDLGMEEEKN